MLIKAGMSTSSKAYHRKTKQSDDHTKALVDIENFIIRKAEEARIDWLPARVDFKELAKRFGCYVEYAKALMSSKDDSPFKEAAKQKGEQKWK
jgi:hypothetical protein